MLPELQAHRPMAAAPHQQHSFNVPAHGQASCHQGHQDVRSNLSFPIRTSRNSDSVLTNTAYAEHRLRRKTPNGTIDVAYDASPLQGTDGPPPYKQMALLPSSFLSPHPYDTSAQAFGGSTLPTQVAQTPRGDLYEEHMAPWPRRHPRSLALITNAGVQPQLWRQQRELLEEAPRAPPQPVLRATEYNVRAFCPPPMPSAAMMPFGQVEWPITNWQGDDRQRFTPGSTFPIPCTPPVSELNSFAEYASPMLDVWSTQPLPSTVGPLYTSTARIPNRFEDAHRSAISSSAFPQAGFRDKVLAQAHSDYMELLSFVQHKRKITQAESGQPGRNVVNLFLYPKPPNPSYRVPSGFTGASKSPLYAFSSDSAGHATPRSFTSPGHCAAGEGSDMSSVYFQDPGAYQNELSEANWRWGSESLRMLTDRRDGNALENASSSLDILTNLCEQSNWKWSEGMLLGGCLLYGLERYTEALKWFSRILTIDQGHVESMTNAAATLYCLDRQQEAEQYWLRAVRMRPSYLEAAEHLVGLLYRKRSKDAIEVVSFVQAALRLHQTKGHTEASSVPTTGYSDSHGIYHRAAPPSIPDGVVTGHDPFSLDAHGFGSSGYALPGRDNGRILALIHAKATMLYGLKDVNRAAEAFEEAVIISVGRDIKDVNHLVRHIRSVLTPPDNSSHFRRSISDTLARPLLLTPERARQTARLAFSGAGELPGLLLVANGPSKRAATQTTSNSLLSLAKIFQDAISHGVAAPHLLRRPPGIGDILCLYYLSLSLQESPSTANNVGILLAGVQPELSSAVTQVTESDISTVPGVTPGSGLALALAYYKYGLRLDPRHVHLHTNLGSLLKDIGQLDLAIQMYEQAVACDGTFDIALTNLANAVKDRGRIQDAIAYYRRAVQSNPDFAEAVCGLFTALNSVCDWRGRGGALLPDRTYDRWHVDETGGLIDAHAKRQSSGLTHRVTQIVKTQLQDASRWGLHTLQDDSIHDLVEQLHSLFDGERRELAQALRQWAGEPWEGSRIVRLVERACRVLQRRWYLDRRERLSSKDFRQHSAQTKGQYRRPRLPSSLTIPPAPTVLPFHTFTCPLAAADVRAISQRNAVRISCSTMKSTWLPDHVYPPPPPPSPQLNVGYISSDFNNHPLAHLMQSVFGLHDPRRVKAFCYATTFSDGSVHRLKIEREAPVFRDVSSWTPSELAGQITKDNIHILVNLNGYTRGARNEIFAARPAPIQMSFMGFAGSLGAEWCDYLLADLTAVPISTLRPWRANTDLSDVLSDESESSNGEWVYSENIIFCRETFFCCDHAQSADEAERHVTWTAEQKRRWAMRKRLFPSLDDDTIILGNFNQLYKIEPTTFRTWLRILDKVPKAILWLLRFPEPGEQYLISTAKAWAGEEVAKRLVFTDVAPKSQHISRARVCDLFLDTPECNAHTTAADVLWSSTPLLTLPRYPYKMCSRMAASILRGAMPKTAEGDEAARELITSSEEEYEASAVLLAGDLIYDTTTGVGVGIGRLAHLRKLLWDNKWTCGLFDTRRWVSDVEDAYEEAWRHWVGGGKGDIFL